MPDGLVRVVGLKLSDALVFLTLPLAGRVDASRKRRGGVGVDAFGTIVPITATTRPLPSERALRPSSTGYRGGEPTECDAR